MSSERYVLESRILPNPWTRRRTVTRPRMLLQVGIFTTTGFWFRIRARGDTFGPYRKRRRIIRQLATRTAFNDFGYKIFLNRKRDGRTLSIHKIEVVDPVPNLGCHPEIEKAYGSLIAKFGKYGIRNGGTWYCRYIDGTRTVSYHGYRAWSWKGAAGDIFSTPDTMAELWKRALHVVAETRAGRLKVDGVIVADRIWLRQTGQWHPYYGAYHSHVHMEVHQGGPC